MTDETAMTGEAAALPVENAASDDANKLPEDAQKVTDKGEAESSTAEGEETTEEKKKPHWATRRIDELTRNWREAERRNDQLLEMVGRLQGAPATQQQVDDTGKPPSLADFNYDETKYQEALLSFATKAAEKTVTTKLSEWEHRQAQARASQSFKQREAEFAATVDDYADKVYDPSVPISSAMAEVIAESDIGPKLAYHLADNRDLAARIAAMSPVQAARELGKIEAKLAAPASKPVSKAPPPPPKIASAEGEVDKDPDKMPVDEWVRWREKQLKTRNR